MKYDDMRPRIQGKKYKPTHPEDRLKSLGVNRPFDDDDFSSISSNWLLTAWDWLWLVIVLIGILSLFLHFPPMSWLFPK